MAVYSRKQEIDELETKFEHIEIFRPVNITGGFDEFYKVSNFGNVTNKEGELLKQCINNNYYLVQFARPIKYYATVSRLVAFTFIPNDDPDTKNIVNHIDENTQNNYYKNLEWVTQKENVNKQTKDTTHKKRIIQKDLDGNVIKVFETVNEAANTIGINRTTIGKVLTGVNKTAGGFFWEYEDFSIRPENREVVTLAEGKCLDFIQEEYKSYYAFKDGRIYNSSRKTFMKPCKNAKNMEYITLPGSGSKLKQNFYVHRLIALAFIPNPDNKKNVNHINGYDNNVENLKWD